MTESVSAACELRTILRANPGRAHDRWRAWSADLMRPGRLSPKLLVALWQEVLDFDPVLATHTDYPVPVPEDAVIVAGSGKETFKTFNVSTAAAILAASVGARVVKGVSLGIGCFRRGGCAKCPGYPVTDPPVRRHHNGRT